MALEKGRGTAGVQKPYALHLLREAEQSVTLSFPCILTHLFPQVLKGRRERKATKSNGIADIHPSEGESSLLPLGPRKSVSQMHYPMSHSFPGWVSRPL